MRMKMLTTKFLVGDMASVAVLSSKVITHSKKIKH